MSKKYKRKTCAYCGVDSISSTGDHILARQFVVERHRANLPQVPACEMCNGKKAKLEHHLTAVMPIGARHEDEADLRYDVHRRLAKNAPLAQQVTRWLKPRWMMSPAGLLELTSVAPVDADALLPWAEMVIRGLALFHWGVVVDPEREVVAFLQSKEEALLPEMALASAGVAIPETSLGNGALVYKALGVDGDLPRSAWRLSLYGAVLGGENPRQRTSYIYGLVSRARQQDRAPARRREAY